MIVRALSAVKQSARVVKPIPPKKTNAVLITKVGWKCLRCDHEWIPKEPGYAPAACPNCKSPYWNRPRRYKRRTPTR